MRTDLNLHSRRSTYVLVVGVVVGMLVAGLAIPYLFGTPLDGQTAVGAGGPLQPRTPADGAPTSVTVAGLPSTADTGTGAAAPAGQGGAAGGSSPASEDAFGTLGGAATPPTGLGASDRGVTADSITIAFFLVDLGGLSQVGVSIPGFDPEEQQSYVNAYVDAVNARGGILGRRIVPEFFSYDPTDPSSGQAACRGATQDREVFAAIDVGGGMDFPAQLCVAAQNDTPLTLFGGFGTTQEMYAASAGNLITVLPSGVRSLANTAAELHGQGWLSGRTIGIVDRDFPGTLQTVTDGMVATLEQLGYRVAYRADLSMDNAIAASQVPLAVQQMRARGVDTVMLLTDFIIGTEFVQAADRSGFRPDYVTSDFEAMTNDTAVAAMPDSFRSIGITTTRIGEWRVDRPEPAIDASCREIYAASSGVNPDRSENSYGGALLSCGMVDLLVRAALAAGPDLTRDGFVAGIQQIGSINYPFFGGVSFSPGKFDGADPIRTITYDPTCSCWLPVGEFKPPTY